VIRFSSKIELLHRIVIQIVEFEGCAIDPVQLPRPVIPRGMPSRDVFGKLGELVDVLLHAKLVVRQFRTRPLLFHDVLQDSITPCRLPTLKQMPEADRLASFGDLPGNDRAGIDSI